jgi:hypothetical protein
MMATSPVPPGPLWQAVTIAASTGYIFSQRPTKNPAAIIALTITVQMTK